MRDKRTQDNRQEVREAFVDGHTDIVVANGLFGQLDNLLEMNELPE